MCAITKRVDTHVHVQETVFINRFVSMASFRASFLALAGLIDGEKHFPPKTPLRWKLIAQYVQKICAEEAKQEVPKILVGAQHSAVDFDYSVHLCKAFLLFYQQSTITYWTMLETSRCSIQ